MEVVVEGLGKTPIEFGRDTEPKERYAIRQYVRSKAAAKRERAEQANQNN
ncbi:hypothetical protein [Haloterrigena salifodinae]|nr:hypothetical protein [Haloterrigena salifodinae]